MRKKYIILIGGISLLFLTGCVSSKKMTYMYKGEKVLTGNQTSFLYDARIMPKDLLTITVSYSEPELAAPFNMGGSIANPLGGSTATSLSATSSSGSSGNVGQTYLVDNDGNIDFPILRTLHLGGKTKGEAEATIKEKLKGYLNETPIVNVRMVNYKFTVIGAVKGANTFTVANEKVNIFEALAMAGDITPFGKKNQVKLLWEDEQGRKRMVALDLNDPDIVNSPYYNLQQNDILYVESGKAAMRSAKMGNITPWVSVLSVLVSLASLGVVLFNK